MSGQVKIKTRCPVCHAKYRVPSRSMGHRARCSKCSTTFRVTELKDTLQPTEEDILKWLNEGMDSEDVPARPRVVSGGDSHVGPTPVGRPADHESERAATRMAEARPSRLPEGLSGPASTGQDKAMLFRKTG